MLVLNFKLTLDEIEQEVYAGKALDAGEIIIWKRWLESQNQKSGRRSRLRAPCCGKSTFRFRLVPDGEGYFYCRQCWDAASQAQWQAELSQPQLTQQEKKANRVHAKVNKQKGLLHPLMFVCVPQTQQAFTFIEAQFLVTSSI